VRITRAEPQRYALDAGRLADADSRALYDAYLQVVPQVSSDGSLDTLFQALEQLQPHIRRFFDKVLVMAEDLEVRRARLGLLQAIGALAEGIVDLTAMEGF
jgi:glycyl-tRNA synthetase